MVAPVALLTDGFGICSVPNLENGRVNSGAKIFTAMVAFDITVIITSLVVGILGATSIIHLSLPLSCSLVGVSGLFILPYAIVFIKGAQYARRNNEKNENGTPRIITVDVTGPFKLIPTTFKAICT